MSLLIPPLAAQNSTSSGTAVTPVSPQPPLDVTKLNSVPRDFLLYRFFFSHLRALDSFSNSVQSGAFASQVAAKNPPSVPPRRAAIPITIAPPAASPKSTMASATTASAAAATLNPAADPKHKIKNDAGLTDAEEATIKSIGAQCLMALATFDQTGFATVKAIAARYPPNAKLSGQDQAQVDELESNREEIVTDAVAQIKSALGPQRFAVLQAFVVGSVAPAIKHRDLPVVRVK